MAYKKIKRGIFDDGTNGNKSWLEEIDENASLDSGRIREEFKTNCDNATFDFGISQKSDDWHSNQELDEATNDSGKSNGSDSRKSDRKTAFKRKAPYDVPQTTGSESTEETTTASSDSKKKTKEYETDPIILRRRQKQIDFGKNTMGYDNYIAKVERKERGKEDPVTPKKHFKYSRRAWDGLIKQWRLRLHNYDA